MVVDFCIGDCIGDCVAIMDNFPYLTFSVNNILYGLSSTQVEEIVFLPELTPVPDAPFDIVGVINLRGAILPVMDLNLRFGYQSPRYQLRDSVVVIQGQQSRLGLIVNAVHEVIQIAPTDIEEHFSYGRELDLSSHCHHFIQGIARPGKLMIVLLDVAALITHHQEAIQQATDPEAIGETPYPSSKLLEQRRFCPEATPAERAIFQQRAEHLRQIATQDNAQGLIPLAVIALNGEFFGIDLKIVREFTQVRKITPVPCCPQHIIGNMNLRGEILTLIDICGFLNLSPMGIAEGLQAMVIEVQGIVIGIIVEQVRDVLFINPKDLTEIPTALQGVNEEYLQGATKYSQKMLTQLNLAKILWDGHLLVDEAV